jgi:protein involved in polysaccharide export with SLBB domain
MRLEMTSTLSARRSLLLETSAFVLLLLLGGAGGVLIAQDRQSAQATTGPAPDWPQGAKTLEPSNYLIGAGDVLDIRVLNRPQYSRENVRVSDTGTISMPRLEGEITAACMTERTLAKEIETRYGDILRVPQVDVFVKEYRSKPVAVIGAVNAPGLFQLQRRVRLLELLAYAGGPHERAGRTLQLVHSESLNVCGDAHPTTGPDESPVSGAEDVSFIDIRETMKGLAEANPYVRQGDVVTLLDADQVYVIGNVLKPTPIPLKESITISQAIAIAGGTMPDTVMEKVKVIRRLPKGSGKTELLVNLKAINQHKADDLELQANDIIEVPTSGSKRFFRTLLGTVAPTIGQLPVRVIR